MELVGRFGWWLPGWLDRGMPRIRLDEAEPATGSGPKRSASAEPATGNEPARAAGAATV
jgi:hypothetical protein